MRTLSLICLAASLTFAGIGCMKAERLYCDSQCARCGRSFHTESKGGKRTKAVTQENALYEWLREHDATLVSCAHDWIPVSGWWSGNNLAWDGISAWDRVLRQIKELDSTLEEDVVRELLDRYYAIYGADDSTEKHRQLEEFRQELAEKLHTIRDQAIQESTLSAK